MVRDLLQAYPRFFHTVNEPASPQKQAVEVLLSRRNIAMDNPEIHFPVVKVKEQKRLGIILHLNNPFLHILIHISLRQKEALEG